MGILTKHIDNLIKQRRKAITPREQLLIARLGVDPTKALQKIKTSEREELRQFLIDKLDKLKITRSSILADREQWREQAMLGRFYFFQYDPKHKLTLPYYDRFPLVIPIEPYPDGFLGLNFHYVHPMVRQVVLGKLMNFVSNKKLTEKTRIQLSYPLLKSASSIFQATPMIHRYLWNHVRSRFVEIHPQEWRIAMMLPVQQFKKQTAENVYRLSMEEFLEPPTQPQTKK